MLLWLELLQLDSSLMPTPTERTLKPGFSEMILVLHMVLRVMKNKLTQSVLTTDTHIGHLKLHSKHTTQQRKVSNINYTLV